MNDIKLKYGLPGPSLYQENFKQVQDEDSVKYIEKQIIINKIFEIILEILKKDVDFDIAGPLYRKLLEEVCRKQSIGEL